MKTTTQNEMFSDGFFLDRGIIRLFGEINDQSANRIISELLFLDHRFEEEKVPCDRRLITIMINSPGGSVSAGLAIYDCINMISSTVRTVAVGTAASMAAFLLCSGSRGERTAFANAEILIHQPLGGTQGQASDLILYAEHIKSTRDKLNRIMAKNTGRSPEQIARDTDRDNILSAEEALEYGLIDRIVESTPKAFPKAESV